ncbi:N-acetylmuramoyl-L-alanine amidase [Clostridium sp. BJN0001]|uniref:N-acetylmuramoyl-L-alanine amidase n=1 Tax=Clostridium sp. BJN0001 TaxID=2930219 RepID=UPI001FD35DDE|nr:N-acetylmuramoyl-L-alanine amidase [Clostridium sp. BJN0001]
MSNVKKVMLLVFSLFVMFAVMPSVTVYAYSSDYEIISDTKVKANDLKEWAKARGATDTFVDLVDLYYKYSKECGDVNPAIAYVQAAKETNFGRFNGVVPEKYCNPCGLKTSAGGANDDVNAHQQFDSWDDGVKAHLDHLALYAGAEGYPKSGTKDPRHFRTLKGKAETVSSLGGKWAPNTSYGDEIVSSYNDLQKSVGIEDTAPKDDKNENSSNAVIMDNPPGYNDSDNNTNKNTNTNINNNTNIISSNVLKYSNTTGWVKDKDVWYYFETNTNKKTGWLKYKNNWYYLDKTTGMMQTGFINDGSFDYYLNPDGIMVTGWKSVNNTWYYFNQGGSMLVSSWVGSDPNWYYVGSNGQMVEGWITYKESKYYLNKGSGLMAANVVVSGIKIGKDGKAIIDNSKEIVENEEDKKDQEDNNTSKKDITIVIDPGHNNGGDGSAQNVINGVSYSELELNMETGQKIADTLESKGYNVVLTRKTGEIQNRLLTDSLKERVKIANNADADLFISIHHNSYKVNSSVHGVEVLYDTAKPNGIFEGETLDSNKVELSKKIAADLSAKISDEFNTNNRGAKEQYLAVCRNTKMPAVLIECGFITNEDEAKRCSDSQSQQKLADVVCEVVEEYF